MTEGDDGDERRYTVKEAARMIGCAANTVRKYAGLLFGPRRRPGAPVRLTAAQVAQLRQVIDAHRASEPYQPWTKQDPPTSQ